MRLLLLLMFILFSFSANAYNLSINVTINTTNQTLFLNISDTLYEFTIQNGTNISLSDQINITINASNFSNGTRIIREFINQTEFLEKADVNIYLNRTCNVPGDFNISTDAKDEIIGGLESKFNTKFDEIQNVIIDDINFQLKPTQNQFDALEIRLDNCNQNVSTLKVDNIRANVQQEKWYFEYEGCMRDNDVWLWISVGLFFVVILVVVLYNKGGLGKNLKWL